MPFTQVNSLNGDTINLSTIVKFELWTDDIVSIHRSMDDIHGATCFNVCINTDKFTLKSDIITQRQINKRVMCGRKREREREHH